MKLREEFEPKIEIARQNYSTIKKKILDYTAYSDENGDEDSSKYKELEHELHKLTGKDMSKFNLWEWWEADGIENLAFRIALPNPTKITDITKEELREVLTRTNPFEVLKEPENDELLMLLHTNKWYYYHDLLKLNFDKYNYKFFSRNKDKNGNYFEYSIDEIVEKLGE